MTTPDVVVVIALAIPCALFAGALFALLLTSVAPPQTRIVLGVLPLAAFAATVAMPDPPVWTADMLPRRLADLPLALMVAETAGAVVAVAVVIRAVARLAQPSPVRTRVSTVAGCVAVLPAAAVLWYGTGLAQVLLTRSFASVQESWIGQDLDADSVAFAGPATLNLIGLAALVAAGAACALLLSRRLPAVVPIGAGLLFLAGPVASVVTAMNTTFTSSYPDPVPLRSALTLAMHVPGNGGALLLGGALLAVPIARRAALRRPVPALSKVPATVPA